MNPNHTDLKRIKGIGEAREKWLKEVLGIKSLEELSQISAETIEAHIKAEGLIVSRDAIDEWIKQAQSFINSESEHSHWIPYASFVIEYQTRTLPSGNKDYRTTAHLMETDQNKSWSGTVTSEIADWILEHTGTNRSDLMLEQPDSDVEVALPESTARDVEAHELFSRK